MKLALSMAGTVSLRTSFARFTNTILSIKGKDSTMQGNAEISTILQTQTTNLVKYTVRSQRLQ